MFILANDHFAVELVLIKVLIQLALIIAVSRVFGVIFRFFRQPAVMGEVVAGLTMGPSLLGKYFPSFSTAIFDPAVSDVFSILSQLGLIFLLFLVGLEFDFSHLKWNGYAAFSISWTGILLPFALGAALAPFMHSHLDQQVPHLGFVLFMGIAMSITAIPVLGRILLELGIARTRIGTVTVCAAAVDDAVGWILLATVASIVQAKFQWWLTIRMIGLTGGYCLLMYYVVRPLLKGYLQRASARAGGEVTVTSMAVILIVLFLSSIATSLIGVFAIFGAFVCGTILSDEDSIRDAFALQLRGFTTVFFLPIFFTYTGLRTDIGSLHSAAQWFWFMFVLLAAVVGKWAGCGLAARMSGFSKREASCIGIMMNTRGLMELIVINVGRDLGVIEPGVFCMLVLMALITTMMTTPILLRLMPGTELEEPIRASGFLKA